MDVACLQEATHGIVGELRQRLGMTHDVVLLPKLGAWAGPHDGAERSSNSTPVGSRPDGCAIVNHRGVFAVSSCVAHYYQDGDPSHRSGHLAAFARLTHPASGRTIGIATTHFKWSPPGAPPDQAIGVRQMRELLATWATVLGDDTPGVICGDFNAESTSEILGILRHAGWADTYATRPQDMTANSKGWVKRIDFLLHNRYLRGTPRPLPPISVETPMPGEGFPSDHQPIVGEFSVVGV